MGEGLGASCNPFCVQEINNTLVDGCVSEAKFEELHMLGGDTLRRVGQLSVSMVGPPCPC